MSIVIAGKESFIIDRTLINITQKSFNKSGLSQFCENLKKVGVDFFEIDEKTFNIVRPLIRLENFILRIDRMDQLETCKSNKIEYIIVREVNLEFIKINYIEENYDFKIILEIDINTHSGDFMKKIGKDMDLGRFLAIRFKGESNWFTNYYIQENVNMKTNVYACDEFSMATAAGLQAIHKGVDYVTTAFCGTDGIYGTTALEELLLSIKVIMGAQVNGELCLLSEMRDQYEKITYIKLPNNKPVIGRDIFKYESGVHVAGIDKNPVTYEPFMPEMVGMERKLSLGKHSGKNSINAKLKELGMDNNYSTLEIVKILDMVKSKSIRNKMELSDNDFIDICNGIMRRQYV